MEIRFLVTTSIEETWPDDDQPVLFLGEWCRLYKRKKQWSNMNAMLLPYHWDDRTKLYDDYQYLQSFQEKLLVGLTEKLNEIHSVERSTRHWRILIGPWLGYFVAMLFDRWTCIQEAVDKYEISETRLLSVEPDDMIPNDMHHFVSLFVSDLWNHHLYSEILKHFTMVKTESVSGVNYSGNRPLAHKNGGRLIKKIKSILLGSYLFIVKSVIRPKDALFISTYLPIWANIRLQMKLGQVPNIPNEVKALWVGSIDTTKRNWSLPGESSSAFEKFAQWIIPKQIPKVYLEGYKDLVSQGDALPWPKYPKIIWTSNSHNSNDVFKAWAALKVENGSPLIIGQHGGHYGIGKWSFAEEHDTAISDGYLTWGWNDSSKNNIIPLGQLTSKRPTKIEHSKQPNALLVLTSMPRYSYWMYSACIAGQYNNYIEDIFSFVAHLTPAVRAALIIRLLKHDFGCSQVERWGNRYPDVRLDVGQSKIDDLINQSRLYISTYNATTFLESFTMNIPTVMFWNPKHWELRDSAVPYFEKLERVGVFHQTPESAADHVVGIWDDVNSWWNSADVQKTRKEFCKQYSNLPENLLEGLENVLKTTIASSEK